MKDGHEPEAGYHLSPELYDRVYADLTADIPVHVAECRAARGRVLEVCCGTGRLLVPALESGVVCDGLDLDAAMLDCLRAKLAERRLSARLFQADMRDFTLPSRYARIVIGFNSFLHNLTQGDQLRTLRCCREHLEPGGSLQLVAFHPSVTNLIEYDAGERLSKEIAEPTTGRSLRVWDRTETDLVEQVRRVFRRVEECSADGAVTATWTLSLDLRYVWKPEMELLLQTAGFRRWDVRPLFDDPTGAAPPPPERPRREGEMLLWTAWTEGA
jgi:SAM-dependent methyltransferase